MTDETDAAGEPTTPGDPPHDSAGAAATPGTNAADADGVACRDGGLPRHRARGVRRGLRREHRLALSITGGVLALALLGTGAVFAGAAVSGGDDVEAVVATSTPTPTADPARPAPAAAAAASRIRTCSVADRAADGRLANLQAQVVNAATGEVLYDRGGTTPSRTASVMKVLTSRRPLGARSRLSRHDDRGEGHRARLRRARRRRRPHALAHAERDGDGVSRRRPPRRARRAGAAAWDADPANPPLTKLILDAGLFGGDEWEPSWDPAEREFGYMSNITALQVDGDRDDGANTSWRSGDPIGRAGDAFASELGGISVIERGPAPAGAAQLGQVASPTVAQLIDKALVVSDNTVAEMLARLVAIKAGTGNTFGAINAAVLQGLAPTASTPPASRSWTAPG